MVDRSLRQKGEGRDIIGYDMYGNSPENVLVFHGWGLDHSAFASMHPALDTQALTFAFMDRCGCGFLKDQNGLLMEHRI